MEHRRRIPVRLSQRELLLLLNSINETLNAVDEWEFEIRVGVGPDEARDLHARLQQAFEAFDEDIG